MDPAAGGMLVADIGGTNARFAVARRASNGRFLLDNIATFEIAGATIESCLELYIAGLAAPPPTASISAAGPVIDGRVELLNSDWIIDAAALWDRFGFEDIALHNDFAAMARAAPELVDDDLARLHAGAPHPAEPVVVGGPGTGFGLAVLTGGPGDRRIISGEGGHRAYAPQTPFEWEVFRALGDSYDYISVEVVTGGKHVAAVYRAVCRVLGAVYEATEPRLILARAQSGNEACQALCQLRAETTLSVLGDVALMAGGARGGVFIAGGEALRLRDYMAAPEALARFHARGPRTDYLSAAPVSLIINPEAGLIGAAALGFERFG